MQIDLPYLYQPRSYQAACFKAWQEGKRRFCTVWPRKAGKDLTWWNFIIARAVEVPGVYWYVLPTIEQAKKVIWYGFSKATQVDDMGEPVAGVRYLDHIPKELLAKPPNNSDFLVSLKNGSIIQLIGSDKLDSIIGPNPVGVVFSEYKVQYPQAWEQVVSPVLENNGGWAAFNSTPQGRNHLFKLWEGAENNPDRWFCDLRTIEGCFRDSAGEDGRVIVTRAQIDQLRAEGQDEGLIQQEYYCSFYGVYGGSYYALAIQELRKQGRINALAWNPRYPVFTAWDLGMADMTSIWFAQVIDHNVHLIDFYQNSGQGLQHYLSECRNKPYVYSSHWAPWDINTKEFTSGVSRKDAASMLGFHFRVCPKLSLDDGIDAVRRILPRCLFDITATDLGLRCLENYSREQRPNGEYANLPKHDKWSHGADAFRYLAMIADREDSAYMAQVVSETEFNIFDREYN